MNDSCVQKVKPRKNNISLAHIQKTSRRYVNLYNKNVSEHTIIAIKKEKSKIYQIYLFRLSQSR